MRSSRLLHAIVRALQRCAFLHCSQLQPDAHKGRRAASLCMDCVLQGQILEAVLHQLSLYCKPRRLLQAEFIMAACVLVDTHLLKAAQTAMLLLRRCTSDDGSGSSGGSSSGSGSDQQPSLLSQLEQAMARMSSARDSIPTAQRMSFPAILQALIPEANRLATLVVQFYQQPEQAVTAHLEMAQPAAARSCAYLRCSNVCLEGRPAAGQGQGSMRCRCGWGATPGVAAEGKAVLTTGVVVADT